MPGSVHPKFNEYIYTFADWRTYLDLIFDPSKEVCVMYLMFSSFFEGRAMPDSCDACDLKVYAALYLAAMKIMS